MIQFDKYFSDGLKPPTREVIVFIFFAIPNKKSQIPKAGINWCEQKGVSKIPNHDKERSGAATQCIQIRKTFLDIDGHLLRFGMTGPSKICENIPNLRRLHLDVQAIGKHFKLATFVWKAMVRPISSVVAGDRL